MKQLSLLLLAVFLAFAARSATVSGTVMNGSTGNPISGQQVDVHDGSSTFTLSATTNASGYFSVTLPSSIAKGTQIVVQASGCASASAYMNSYAGTSFTCNLFMCDNGVNRLNGSIWLGANIPNTGPATVWFIEKKWDPVVMDTTLTAIDSTTTSVTGAYSKAFSSIPGGAILMKAALLPSHPDYANYLPTYAKQSFLWSYAIPISAKSFTTPYAVNDITMAPGANPGGPGFISGAVLMGANKSTAVGDPLSSRILILTSTTGQVTAYTYSDATGKFKFSNLPYGTYKISGDALGKNNPELTVTLSAANKTISNIIFEESSKKFEGRFNTLGISGSRELSNATLYPNPAKDYVELAGLDNIGGNKTVVIRDITGALISSHTFIGNTEIRFSTAHLASGLYMVQVQTSEGSASFKLIK